MGRSQKKAATAFVALDHQLLDVDGRMFFIARCHSRQDFRLPSVACLL
jgi:hypothetical protein